MNDILHVEPWDTYDRFEEADFLGKNWTNFHLFIFARNAHLRPRSVATVRARQLVPTNMWDRGEPPYVLQAVDREIIRRIERWGFIERSELEAGPPSRLARVERLVRRGKLHWVKGPLGRERVEIK